LPCTRLDRHHPTLSSHSLLPATPSALALLLQTPPRPPCKQAAGAAALQASCRSRRRPAQLLTVHRPVQPRPPPLSQLLTVPRAPSHPPTSAPSGQVGAVAQLLPGRGHRRQLEPSTAAPARVQLAPADRARVRRPRPPASLQARG
jgi:hypothetical protein